MQERFDLLGTYAVFTTTVLLRPASPRVAPCPRLAGAQGEAYPPATPPLPRLRKHTEPVTCLLWGLQMTCHPPLATLQQLLPEGARSVRSPTVSVHNWLCCGGR